MADDAYRDTLEAALDSVLAGMLFRELWKHPEFAAAIEKARREVEELAASIAEEDSHG